MGAPLAVAAGGVAGLLALHLRDPHAGGAWGVCPVLLLTGFSCPGCGGLRAAYDLSHGDVLGAVASNAWLTALLPLALVAWVRWLWRGVRRSPRRGLSRVDLALWTAVAVSGLAFAVVRNTPWGAGLAP
ncbi:DUF2752 domain-containing protein [Nocardioidaceae bacterium]|nr:DUF2752 domain-containing protein [Nocardioidaceae bacterium]